jgi:hypothetical protein
MKKIVRLSLIGTLFISMFWGCSKNDSMTGTQIPGNLSLKQSLNQGAVNLKSALSQISSSPAYGILTETGGGAKSAILVDSVYKVNISLNLIKGVYNYKPSVKPDKRGFPVLHFFTKTADNSQMIVRMPLQKVQNPWTLRFFTPADSTLKNNFSIAVSDYHNNYNNYFDYDYLLASAITVDNVQTGKLNIQSTVNRASGIHYSSQFAFTGSYTAQYNYASGDTTVSSFGISGNGNLLYQEKLLTIRNDTARFGREFQYILTIGNVQIMRSSLTNTVQISVNGVVQPNASVKIIDTAADSEPSVVKKRDIQITFADGTVTTVSALIGNSITNISSLYSSLHQVYFAANIVDWIAYDIYYQR